MAESTDQLFGKITSVRDMRKTRFVDVYTAESQKLQLLIPRDVFEGSLTQGDAILVKGSHGTSRTGEPSFVVNKMMRRVTYVSSKPFKEIERVGRDELLKKAALTNSIRDFMATKKLIEATTPIMIDKFNGGSSIPMRVSGQREYGFLRTTHEDQLLGIVADSLSSVYQIGPIFKAGKEMDFLEAYILGVDYDTINHFVQEFLKEVAGVSVEYSYFIDLLKKYLSEDDYKKTIDYFNDPSTKPPHITSITSTTSVGFCDKLVSMFAKKEKGWVAIKYLAAAHSPLYQEAGSNGEFSCIERSRIYKDGKVVFDIGVNSLDVESVVRRVQQSNDNTQSPYVEVLQQGLPPVAGFSIRLTELM